MPAKRSTTARQQLVLEDAKAPRAASKAIAAALEKKKTANRVEGQRLRHMLRFENELWAQGITHIAGVDEAGAGPCAGPVVAGATILPQGYKLKGLDDSKKILDEDERDRLAAQVKADAVAWAVGWASVSEIDTINIYQAGLLAMRRAVEGLSVTPHFLLVDARTVPGVKQPQKGIIKGDSLSLSIAAGAILAKTTRDAYMRDLDAAHPGYGFASHKGYNTPEHLDALQRLGVLACHRRSYAPVQRALGLLPTQGQLL
jgi:ribonuclease HII